MPTSAQPAGSEGSGRKRRSSDAGQTLACSADDRSTRPRTEPVPRVTWSILYDGILFDEDYPPSSEDMGPGDDPVRKFIQNLRDTRIKDECKDADFTLKYTPQAVDGFEIKFSDVDDQSQDVFSGFPGVDSQRGIFAKWLSLTYLASPPEARDRTLWLQQVDLDHIATNYQRPQIHPLNGLRLCWENKGVAQRAFDENFTVNQKKVFRFTSSPTTTEWEVNFEHPRTVHIEVAQTGDEAGPSALVPGDNTEHEYAVTVTVLAKSERISIKSRCRPLSGVREAEKHLDQLVIRSHQINDPSCTVHLQIFGMSASFKWLPSPKTSAGRWSKEDLAENLTGDLYSQARQSFGIGVTPEMSSSAAPLSLEIVRIADKERSPVPYVECSDHKLQILAFLHAFPHFGTEPNEHKELCYPHIMLEWEHDDIIDNAKDRQEFYKIFRDWHDARELGIVCLGNGQADSAGQDPRELCMIVMPRAVGAGKYSLWLYFHRRNIVYTTSVMLAKHGGISLVFDLDETLIFQIRKKQHADYKRKLRQWQHKLKGMDGASRWRDVDDKYDSVMQVRNGWWKFANAFANEKGHRFYVSSRAKNCCNVASKLEAKLSEEHADWCFSKVVHVEDGTRKSLEKVLDAGGNLGEWQVERRFTIVLDDDAHVFKHSDNSIDNRNWDESDRKHAHIHPARPFRGYTCGYSGGDTLGTHAPCVAELLLKRGHNAVSGNKMDDNLLTHEFKTIVSLTQESFIRALTKAGKDIYTKGTAKCIQTMKYHVDDIAVTAILRGSTPSPPQSPPPQEACGRSSSRSGARPAPPVQRDLADNRLARRVLQGALPN